ncbi:MAG: hypothetical protein ACYC5Z_06570 [Acidimicrobiales bacterium]
MVDDVVTVGEASSGIVTHADAAARSQAAHRAHTVAVESLANEIVTHELGEPVGERARGQRGLIEVTRSDLSQARVVEAQRHLEERRVGDGGVRERRVQGDRGDRGRASDGHGVALHARGGADAVISSAQVRDESSPHARRHGETRG